MSRLNHFYFKWWGRYRSFVDIKRSLFWYFREIKSLRIYRKKDWWGKNIIQKLIATPGALLFFSVISLAPSDPIY